MKGKAGKKAIKEGRPLEYRRDYPNYRAFMYWLLLTLAFMAGVIIGRL